jgi:hypothetical protein
VANAFGSSVAARTLTMRQALVIAAVCEFSGSVLLGGQVTRTVASGIASLVGGFVSSQPRKKGFDELQNMSQGGITHFIPITKILVPKPSRDVGGYQGEPGLELGIGSPEAGDGDSWEHLGARLSSGELGLGKGGVLTAEG